MHFIRHKRFFILLVGFSLLGSFSFAQSDSIPGNRPKPKNERPFIDRLFWGGNVGAWIGNPTFVDLSPLIGYKVTEKFSVGVGAIYNYYSYRYNNFKYEAHFYGGRIMGRYFILENVYLQAGYDRINRDNPYSFKPDARIWIENVLIGGGLRYPVSDNIFCVASGLWNLNDTPLSPYPNPIIQIGFIGSF
jgi:hypothetical protein